MDHQVFSLFIRVRDARDSPRKGAIQNLLQDHVVFIEPLYRGTCAMIYRADQLKRARVTEKLAHEIVLLVTHQRFSPLSRA